MDLYTRLLADLGLPAWIGEVRNGRWLADAMVWEAPADWYTCPPALVPLTSDGSGPRYVGIWVAGRRRAGFSISWKRGRRIGFCCRKRP